MSSAHYPMFAAGGIEVTPDMVGRRVRFKRYEGYEGQKTLEGEGVIQQIDHQRQRVLVKMPFKRTEYGREGYNIGDSDLLVCSAKFEFEKPGRPQGHWLDYEDHGYQFDYPKVWKNVFELLP